MASGSSGRASHSGSKAFDFGSDDILCSYEDYGNPDGNNGIHTDPTSIANSAKEFNKSRVARSSGFPAPTYSTPDESSFNESVISTVENTMKKYTDNLMRFLEGISSRLSQLELYCYNLDKSIGEMRSDLSRDHGESESKLKSLERHIQEVHRSVQILRDKQELADTQKELAKLQLAQKEEDRSSAPSSESKKANETPSDGHDQQQQQQQQLALALPHQVAPPQQPSIAPPQSSPPMPPPQTMGYYLPPPPQMTTNNNIPPPSQTPQYLPPATQTPPPPQPQVNQQSPQVVQSLSPYPPQQQQWAPQQPVQPPAQQQLMQPQIRTSSQMGVYSSYQPANQPPPEMTPNSLPMQKPSFQPGSEAIAYGYGAGGRPIQQQPPLKTSSGYGPQSAANNNNNAYMVYDGEGGGRTTHHHLPPQFQQQNAYPPTSMPPQRTNPNINMVVPQSSMRSHPYNELIDKLVSMGYRGDHVVAIIQRLDESGQPIDFNSVLDMLNGHSHSSASGGSQRGWRP